VPFRLEAVLIGNDGQDSLEALVPELLDSPAANADQVMMVGLRRHGLKAAKPLPEITSKSRVR
jgi:hypothetical protein